MSESWSVGQVVRRLLEPEGLADPYSIYREIRAAAEDGAPTGRFLFRYDDVRAALQDPTLSSDRVGAILRPLPDGVRAEVGLLEKTLRDIVVFTDQPDHRRVRRLLTQAFTPRMVEAARPMIEQVTEGLLDAVDRADGSQGVVDLHGDLTYPLPATVVAALLGIPEESRAAFRAWALDIVLVVGSGTLTPELAARANGSMARMRELMAELVEQRRRAPGPDLLSAMIAATDEGDRLSVDELYANALFLMTAGHETATNMLSNALLTLLRHPDQLKLLRAEPELLDTAIEESIRFEGPVQIAARIADRDRELRGLALRAGQPLIAMIGAANRDPDTFTDPDRFDISRREGPNVGFAQGAHYCLGAALARAEMRVVLPAVLDRYPALRLAEDQPSWQPTLDFRGPERLLVHR
ncbi:MAG TPA: cytochrome P450 [Pseudonocardia sp.]|nr:cytochrome P450 [Pseudonocardia sp.]